MKFDGVYYKWNAVRLKALYEHYGKEWLSKATILEVGCGYGDMGYELQKLGADVTFLDARADHLDYIKERDPDSKTIVMDIDRDWPEGEWDLIIHFGVLYHLQNPVVNLRKACGSCQFLVLETEVVDSADLKKTKKHNEDMGCYTQSISGAGVRLSPPKIESILTEEGLEWERKDDSSLNVSIHRYAWKAENKGAWSPGLRRFWFGEKRNA